jgi:predicted HTH transcriptional regulator
MGHPLKLTSIFITNYFVKIKDLTPISSLDDIRQGVSKLRNRVLGRIFRELGLIEQWGSGLQRMFSACAEAGQDEPHIEELRCTSE